MKRVGKVGEKKSYGRIVRTRHQQRCLGKSWYRIFVRHTCPGRLAPRNVRNSFGCFALLFVSDISQDCLCCSRKTSEFCQNWQFQRDRTGKTCTRVRYRRKNMCTMNTAFIWCMILRDCARTGEPAGQIPLLFLNTRSGFF